MAPFHPGDLSAPAAMRLSSSGPEGPSDSVRLAPLVSFCSARDPRATPWPFRPRALMERGRHKSSLQRPGASPRGRSPRPNPRPSRSCGVSSSSRDGPRFDLSRTPFVDAEPPRRQGSSSFRPDTRALLLALPRRRPPSRGRVPSITAESEGFPWSLGPLPLRLSKSSLGGKTPFFPLRTTGSV